VEDERREESVDSTSERFKAAHFTISSITRTTGIVTSKTLWPMEYGVRANDAGQRELLWQRIVKRAEDALATATGLRRIYAKNAELGHHGVWHALFYQLHGPSGLADEIRQYI
jgi:hypothetical protein